MVHSLINVDEALVLVLNLRTESVLQMRQLIKKKINILLIN